MWLMTDSSLEQKAWKHTDDEQPFNLCGQR